MGRAVRKRVLGHMRIANAQISLCINTVWSGPLLSANGNIRYYRMFQWGQRPGWYFAHEQDDVNLHILHMLEDTFSLNVAQMQTEQA